MRRGAQKRQNPARHDRLNLYRKRYLWSVAVVALPGILRSCWRSRILGRHGSLCHWLAAYAAAVCLRILDDLKNDPIEGHNVAGDPAHATDLAHFRARLATLKKEVGGASIEQLQNMPYGEPKTGREKKAGEE